MKTTSKNSLILCDRCKSTSLVGPLYRHEMNQYAVQRGWDVLLGDCHICPECKHDRQNKNTNSR